MALKATQVFTPGSYPEVTYVQRVNERLAQSLKDALDTPGQIIALSGPSKSGKTVLVERVVGRENLITIPGAGITGPDDVWDRVLDRLRVPNSESRERTIGGSVRGEISGTGGFKLPGMIDLGAEAKGGSEAAR